MEATQAPPSVDTLPRHVTLTEVPGRPDERGLLTEIYRENLNQGLRPVQWNVVASRAGVLRGVHVHRVHADYLLVISGRATIGLRDLRRSAAEEPWAGTVEMSGDKISALTIPPGVAHGFYFHEPSTFIYGVTEYWNPQDELGCHWADPALEIPWPVTDAIVSERDANAPSLSSLLAQIEPWQPL